MSTTDNSTHYDEQFFEDQVDGSLRSAKYMVPAILELHGGASSAIDIGCGTGSWLSQYATNGIEDYLGVDGYLPSEGMLRIPSENTKLHDLRKPLNLGRRFDIVQSMEVAEHLPVAAAATFVKSLTDHGDFVVFGAAVPGQGGTRHINEKWQSYWHSLFSQRGYVSFDPLRNRFWYEKNVEWWYAQNTLVYVNSENKSLVAEVQKRVDQQLSLVDVIHPSCFRQVRNLLENSNNLIKHKYAPQVVDSAYNAQLQEEKQALLDVVIPQLQEEKQTLLDVVIPQLQEEKQALLAVVPDRFKSLDRARKMISESKPWYSFAFRHPTRISLWLDLYRVQRRRARREKRQN